MAPSPSVLPPHEAGWRLRLRRTLIAGLLILTPATLTALILFELFQFMDGIFAPLLDRLIRAAVVTLSGPEAVRPGGYRIPGLGLAMTLLAVLVLGWLSTNVVGRSLVHGFERLIARIPGARSIYSATKGVLEALSRDQRNAFKGVVLVEYPKDGLFALGFITEHADWSAVDPRLEDTLMVFVPTAPNPTSGFLLLIPEQAALPVPISVEEGIRMVISGGILQPRLPGPPEPRGQV